MFDVWLQNTEGYDDIMKPCSHQKKRVTHENLTVPGTFGIRILGNCSCMNNCLLFSCNEQITVSVVNLKGNFKCKYWCQMQTLEA